MDHTSPLRLSNKIPSPDATSTSPEVKTHSSEAVGNVVVGGTGVGVDVVVALVVVVVSVVVGDGSSVVVTEASEVDVEATR